MKWHVVVVVELHQSFSHQSLECHMFSLAIQIDSRSSEIENEYEKKIHSFQFSYFISIRRNSFSSLPVLLFPLCE